MEFENKIVVVTGASAHTGLHLAERFLKANAVVFPVCKTGEEADEVMSRFGEEHRGRVKRAVCDLSDPQGIVLFFKGIDRIDVLVNNACVQGTGYGFLEAPVEHFHQVMAVNIEGMLLASQLAARKMALEKRGVIVNISSNTSHRAIRNRVSYITSKGGVEAATRAMALDLSAHNIRVNAVAPGYINTSRWEEIDTATSGRRRNNIPLGRELDFDDVYNAVSFLASDKASKITGECVVVDGGCTGQLFPEDCDM